MPPSTNKRRMTTNLKTKNNQNFQKIELYGSLITKELKKKHSSRLVGGWRRAAGAERMHGKAVAGGQASKAVAGKPGGPTFVCQ